MRIRAGITFASVAVVVFVIVGAFLVHRNPDLNPSTYGERAPAGTSVILGGTGMEEMRQKFSDTASRLHNLTEQQRNALLSLYWDSYVMVADGKCNEFLAKWVDESLFLIGSRYTSSDEPFDEMSKRFEKIRNSFDECLELIGTPITPEIKAAADENVQYGFVAAEELVIDFLNHLKNVKMDKGAYERMYQSKPARAVGDDFIKGVSSSLFTSDPRTEEIIIGVTIIASLRDQSKARIRERIAECFNGYLRTNCMVLEDDLNSLVLVIPQPSGFGLGCAIMGFLADYKQTDINRLVRQLAQGPPSLAMPPRKYVTLDKSAVFPSEIPTVEKGGMRSYPLSQ